MLSTCRISRPSRETEVQTGLLRKNQKETPNKYHTNKRAAPPGSITDNPKSGETDAYR